MRYKYTSLQDCLSANIDTSGNCWLWKLSCDRKGYGQVQWRGQIIRAHRAMMEVLLGGPIPDGLFVLHDCPEGDNPRCVNPTHLWLGTQRDNVNDMRRKGRGFNPPLISGQQHPKAKLSDQQIVDIRHRRANKETLVSLAAEYGVAHSLISRIGRRVVWRHVP